MIWYMIALTVALAYIKDVLAEAAEEVWEDLWEAVYGAVVWAEEQWGDGLGAEKLAYVKEQALKFLGQHVKLTFWQRIAAGYMIGQIVSAGVKEFNERMGGDWLAAAKAKRAEFEEMFPFLKDDDNETPAADSQQPAQEAGA